MFHKPFPSEIKEEKHGTKRKHEPSRRGKERAEAKQLLVFDTGVDQKIVAAERPMNPAEAESHGKNHHQREHEQRTPRYYGSNRPYTAAQEARRVAHHQSRAYGRRELHHQLCEVDAPADVQ